MKIDAPRADIQLQPGGWLSADTLTSDYDYWGDGCLSGRIVRESDWRKIMAVLRAAERNGTANLDVKEKYDALCQHLERKRK
jgi:hypothetical protein